MKTIKDKIKKKKAICIILGIITILTIFLTTYPAKKIDATSKTDEKIITEKIKENKEQDTEKSKDKQQETAIDDKNKESDTQNQNSLENQPKTVINKLQEKSTNTTGNSQSNKDISKSNTMSANKNSSTEANKNESKSDSKKDSSTESGNKSKPTVQTKDTSTVHNHKWTAVYKTVHHDAVGHYETKTVQKAYDEPIYKSINICNKCGIYSSEFKTMEDFIDHTIFECVTGYHSADLKVGTKHHDAVTKKVWVVDKKAYDEKVITGYKCSCGATK